MADEKYEIHRANLAYVRKQITDNLGDIDSRLKIVEAGGGGIAADYLWSTLLSGDPTSGHIGANNTVRANITEIFMSKISNQGNDLSAVIQDLKIGAWIGIFEINAPFGTSLFATTAVPVLTGDYFTIAVSPQPYTGQAIPTVQDAPLNVTLTPSTSNIPHDELIDVLPDQHHPQSHVHNGLDGSGVVPHVNTSGQTVDDHHKQVHTHDGTPAEGGAVNHSVLSGVSANQHHNQAHLLYGADQTDVNIDNAIQDAQGLFWLVSEFLPDWRSKYLDQYVGGVTYPPQTWTASSDWISIANAFTLDSPFPSEVGGLIPIYPPDPPFSTLQNTSQVRSGYYVNFTESGEVRALQVWIPEITPDTHYAVAFIKDPNGATPQIGRYVLDNANLTAGQWNTVALGSQLYLAGQEILMYLEADNFGSTSQVTGGWTFEGAQNISAPPPQNWNHNNGNTIVRIDKTDLNSTDRTSELLGIGAGSTIQFIETASPTNVRTYTVLDPPTDLGTYVEYAVALSVATGSIPDGAVTTMTAEVPVAQPTRFVFETDKFLVNPPFAAIDSFLQYDGVTQAANPDTGYGINFNFQQLDQSPDWDLISIGGGGGGGGGEFTPTIFAGAGTTGYVPDPITESLRHLSDDGTWKLTDHDDLTNVSADQHHPQLHDLTSHTDVVITTPKANQGIWWDAITSAWVNGTAFEESWATALIDGGELNITVGEIEVLTGLGLVSDTYTDPISPPAIIGLRWNQINTPITAAPAVAGSVVWFSIYNTGVPSAPPIEGGIEVFVGDLHQFATSPSPTLSRKEIFLGIAIHNGVEWKEVSNPKVINQAAETLREVAVTVLPLSTIIQGGATHSQTIFQLRQDTGTIWENNRNWHNDKSDPNRETLPASNPIVFQYVNRDFTDVSAPLSAVDPSMWDDAGTVVPVTGTANTATIQRLYLDPANNYWMLWGQNEYTNARTAVANLPADTFNTIVPFILQNSILLGYAICENSKTDWDIDEAIWYPENTGASGGGGGGTPITDHDNLNGITPDNHHNQIHDHSGGGQAGGLVDYGVLTGTPWTINVNDIYNNNSGNVGIGTQTPISLFTIQQGAGTGNIQNPNSTVTIDSDANAQIQMLSSDTGRNDILFGRASSQNAGALRYWHSDNAMAFDINASERMRITSAGNVGIGTITPLVKLDLNGDTGAYSASNTDTNALLRLQNSGNTDGDAVGISFISHNTSGDLKGCAIKSYRGSSTASELVFITSNATTPAERMRITSAGNVGIGTTNPVNVTDQKSLTIEGVTAARVDLSSVNFNSAFMYITNKFALGSTEAIPVTFTTSNAERMRILSDGNTLINAISNTGVAAPTEKLFVEGDVNIAAGYNYHINGVPLSSGGGTDVIEGEWTPVNNNGTMTMATDNIGYYSRVGNMVTAWANVEWSARTSSTVEIKWGGLPFTVKNTTKDMFVGTFQGLEGIQLSKVDTAQTGVYAFQMGTLLSKATNNWAIGTYFGTNDDTAPNQIFTWRFNDLNPTGRFALQFQYLTDDPQGKVLRQESFKVAGNFTFTPQQTGLHYITVVGGGGTGYRGTLNQWGGNGGGGAEAVTKWAIEVGSLTGIPVTVGGGGADSSFDAGGGNEILAQKGFLAVNNTSSIGGVGGGVGGGIGGQNNGSSGAAGTNSFQTSPPVGAIFIGTRAGGGGGGARNTHTTTGGRGGDCTNYGKGGDPNPLDGTSDTAGGAGGGSYGAGGSRSLNAIYDPGVGGGGGGGYDNRSDSVFGGVGIVIVEWYETIL